MIIHVPQDYPTIQEAVDVANPGDRIEVSPGNYNETVIIDTPHIDIKAALNVVMDGDEVLENAFNINADYVTIEGFRITRYVNGIRFIANRCHIKDCIITFNNRYALFFEGDYNCITGSSIAANNVSGINFMGKHNFISNNTIDGNRGAGVSMLFPCESNVIAHNILSNSTVGVSSVNGENRNNAFNNNLLQVLDYGMLLSNDCNHILHNTFNTIKVNALLILGSCNHLSHNVMQCAPQGIVLLGKKNHVYYNAISYSATAGITVSGEESILCGNIITNSNIGIIRTTDDASIDDTTYYANGKNLVVS